jgi:hypothetical protein
MSDTFLTMIMTIDRMEDGYFILIPRDHPEETIQIPKKYMTGFEEGDVLELLFRKDETETREARDRISRIRERLTNR